MITGVIHVEGPPEELAASLGALVPAVVEGLMGDAVIVAGRADPALTTISEISGAKLLHIASDADPWRAGAALARRPWLLCLQSGDVPGEGWMRAADRFLAAAVRSGQPLGRLARRRSSPGTVLAALAERLAGTRQVRAGDLVRRDWLMAQDMPRVRPARIGASVERDFALR